MSGDKHQSNGTDPVENGINGAPDKDTEMQDNDTKSTGKAGKDKDGDDEMTVVVPPSKGQKLSGASNEDHESDVAMNGVTEDPDMKPVEIVQDPHSKAVSGKHD